MVFNVEEYEQDCATEETKTKYQKYPGMVNNIRQWALSHWRSVFQPDENNKTF